MFPMAVCPCTLCVQKPVTSPSPYHVPVITLAPLQTQAVVFMSACSNFGVCFPFCYAPQTLSGPLKCPWTLTRNAPKSRLPALFGSYCAAQNYALRCPLPHIKSSCNLVSPLLFHWSKLAAPGSRSQTAFGSNLLFVHLCSKGQATLVSHVDPTLSNPFIWLSYTCYVTLL